MSTYRRFLDTLLLMTLLSLTSPAHARCDTESGNSYTINACAEKEFNETDKMLNAAYKQVMAFLANPKNDINGAMEIKKYLIEGQRAWVTFRDKDCTAVELADGYNTIHAGYHHCMARHTKIRTAQILKLHEQLQELHDR